MKIVTREELYDAVWSTPVSKLAADWGVTAWGVVQACEKLRVPRPASGYWSAVRSGWKAVQPALPPAEAGGPAATQIADPHVRLRSSKLAGPGMVVEAPRVPVPQSLRSPHPLVAQMKRNLQDAEPHYIYSVMDLGARQKLFRVRVTRGLIHRAVCILDALVKAAEGRGAKFERKDEVKPVELTMGDESVDFILSEVLEKRERTAKNEEERRSWRWNPFVYESTGRLRLMIDGYCPGATKKKWEDCETYRLEDVMGEILESVFSVFEGIKEDRERMRRQQEVWEAERRRAQEECERQEAERVSRKSLEEKAQAWEKARSLRVFISACEERMKPAGGTLAAGGWEERWLFWARAHADRLDPLACGFLQDEEKRFQKSSPVGGKEV